MPIVMFTHILAGSLGLITGYVALYASKGAPLHRRAGMAFVVAMLTMTFFGTIIAAVRGAAPALNIPAAIVTAYLVVTALTTVRPPAAGARALAVGGMLVSFAVGVTCVVFGIAAIADIGVGKGLPPFPFFMFALIALPAAIGDLRMMRAGGVTGISRIRRHLWRMSVALFIAAMSFFIGQADEFPPALRIRPLLAIPPFVVLGTMAFWLWRVRRRKNAGETPARHPQGVGVLG